MADKPETKFKPPRTGIDALGDLRDEMVSHAEATQSPPLESDLERSKREAWEAFEERMAIDAIEDHLFLVEYARKSNWTPKQLIEKIYPHMSKALAARLLAHTATIDGVGRVHRLQ